MTTKTPRNPLSDLLAGASDPDGDSPVPSTSRSQRQGEIVNNNDGPDLQASMNFNGDVAFSYDITDGNGATIATDQSFFLEPVNDAPGVSGVVDLAPWKKTAPSACA